MKPSIAACEQFIQRFLLQPTKHKHFSEVLFWYIEEISCYIMPIAKELRCRQL